RRPVRAPSGTPQFCRATHMAQPLRRLAAQLRTHTRDSQLELPISPPYSRKLRDRLRTSPPPSAVNTTFRREDVDADGRGLGSGVRVSFAMPTKIGRNTSAEGGGWGVRPFEEVPGSARARKAPAPLPPARATQKISCIPSPAVSWNSMIRNDSIRGASMDGIHDFWLTRLVFQRALG